MAVRIELTLTDATAQPPVGGGSVQVLLRKDAALVWDSGRTPYTKPLIIATAPVNSDWTHASVRIEPDSYALQGVTLSRSGTDLYRNNANARAVLSNQGNLALTLPLLRLREAPGAQPSRDPHPGDALTSAWLARRQGMSKPVYRELLVTDMVKSRQLATVGEQANRFGTISPLANADDPDPWGRFNNVTMNEDPTAAGASLLLEYGETGAAAGGGPRFLIGIWVPSRSTGAAAGAFPAWRDFDVFLHPSTAKPWFPESAWPFTANYPYIVADNTNVAPGDPDRVFQPYVNLALKYVTGIWSQFQQAGRDAVFVVPIFPHPKAGSRDEHEYGLPFTTQTGLARLLAEVNLFLHQTRYGWPGIGLDTFGGAAAPGRLARSPADAIAYFADDRTAPPLRKVAVAAFSASSTQMHALLSTPSTTNARFPADRWSVRSAGPFRAWVEAWVIDHIFGAATVAATTFESALLAWLGADEARRFYVTNCGTTGGADPDKLYPKLAKLARSRQRNAGTDPARIAQYWRGAGDRWSALFCSNPYLAAAGANTFFWPAVITTTDPDDFHAFMFILSSGLIHGWSLTGRP